MYDQLADDFTSFAMNEAGIAAAACYLHATYDAYELLLLRRVAPILGVLVDSTVGASNCVPIRGYSCK